MKKYLILGLVVVCFILILKCDFCESSEQEILWVEVKQIVQDEVIIITAPGSSYHDPTSLFIIGIQKLGGRYIIKSITPINEKYGYGSRTSSIILLVEKRKN